MGMKSINCVFRFKRMLHVVGFPKIQQINNPRRLLVLPIGVIFWKLKGSLDPHASLIMLNLLYETINNIRV